MSKTSKVKAEMVDVRDLLDVIQVLKDIADMRYHSLMAQKEQFQRFHESFAEFFRLVSFSPVRHPLVSNDNSTLGIVIITTEQGFVGDLNTKVVDRALMEREKSPNARIITIGRRGVAKLDSVGVKCHKAWEDIEETGLYEVAVQLKTYLVDQVMTNKIGRVVAIYPWPKDFMTLKARAIRLLPCEDLLATQAQSVERFKYVIEESDPVDMIGYLADIWLTTRLYELLNETTIAAAAAQSAQLESSLSKMKKENSTVRLTYRKARKGDIDRSLREIFASKSMLMK